MSESDESTQPKAHKGSSFVELRRQGVQDPGRRQALKHGLIGLVTAVVGGSGIGLVSGMKDPNRSGANIDAEKNALGNPLAKPEPTPVLNSDPDLTPPPTVLPQTANKNTLNTSTESDPDFVTELDGSRRNQLGKLIIPETVDGLPLSLKVQVLDNDGKPVKDPQNPNKDWEVSTTFHHVRQYQKEGGAGYNQYKYVYDSVGNSTMVTGSKDKPHKRELVIRAHSGHDIISRKPLDAEPLHHLHDRVYDLDKKRERERTDEEKKEFRENHRFIIKMMWPDDDGKEVSEQLCEARLYHIDEEGTKQYWEDFRKRNDPNIPKGQKKDPTPRLSDYVKPEERGGLPDEFHPWQDHALLYFCGESTKPGTEFTDSLFFHVRVLDKNETDQIANSALPPSTN